MKISILIAAYNAAEFISTIMQDALSQSEPPHEIIVVNDASTDNTVEVISGLAAKSNLIRLVDLPTNGGPALARNAGIKAAGGDWIAIIDADDRIETDYIEVLSQQLNEHEVDIIATNFYWYDPHKDQKLSPGLEAETLPRMVNLHAFLCGARPFSDEADYGLLKPVFRRAFLAEHRITYPTDLRHGEDFMILTESLLNGARFRVLSEPLYLYTVRSSGFSKTIVNYPRMAHATRELLTHPVVKLDVSLQELLESRATNIEKLNAQQSHNQHKNNHQYGSICRNTISNRYYRDYVLEDISTFAGRAGKKILKVLRIAR